MDLNLSKVETLKTETQNTETSENIFPSFGAGQEIQAPEIQAPGYQAQNFQNQNFPRQNFAVSQNWQARQSRRGHCSDPRMTYLLVLLLLKQLNDLFFYVINLFLSWNYEFVMDLFRGWNIFNLLSILRIGVDVVFAVLIVVVFFLKRK